MYLFTAVFYGFVFAVFVILMIKTNTKIKNKLSHDIIFFDGFNLAYKVTAIISCAAIFLVSIYISKNESLSAEALNLDKMVEDILGLTVLAFFNLFFLLHAFNSKILIFKEYFLLVNFMGGCKKYEFVKFKNSTENYTNLFLEGYIFRTRKEKVKIQNYFSNMEDILKIIRENTR